LGPLRSERQRLAWAYGRPPSRSSGTLRCKAAHCACIPSGCTRNWRAPGRRHQNACPRQSSWRILGRRRRRMVSKVGARFHYATRPATRLCEGQAPLQRSHGGLWKPGASDGRPAWEASRPCAIRWAREGRGLLAVEGQRQVLTAEEGRRKSYHHGLHGMRPSGTPSTEST
jgi:hypothetical protein